MQVLKKISSVLLCLGLAACASSSPKIEARGGIDDMSSEYSEITLSGSKSFRAGVLLPLTGNAAKYGQGLRNATLLALDDIKNSNLILQFYDTKSTPEGARTAIENAINQKADVIIGPLTSSSVQAISPQTTSRNIPVIAFSTSEDVLEPQVYTLGLLTSEQVDRIITYAVREGRSRLALLLPDNPTGIAVAKAAAKSAMKNNIRITKIGFYQPNTSDFSEILKQMTNFYSRNAQLLSQKKQLEALAAQGDTDAARQLRTMSDRDAAGDVNFDMVLIPESGPKLKSAISMFGYYDVYAPKVKFLGTSIWENSNLNNESIVIGSWYPVLSRSHSSYFANKYTSTFGERPSTLYSLAYDAVALTNALANNPGSDLNGLITNPDGYVGINGVFRLFADGHNQHSLDIMEVTKNGDVIVDAAPKKFGLEETSYSDGVVSNSFEMPEIYGKDKSIAQSLIFGHLYSGNASENVYQY